MPKAKWGCLLEDAETDVCVSSVGVYDILKPSPTPK